MRSRLGSKGQATSEYLLLLVIVLGMFLVLKRTFGPMLSDMQARLVDRIENTIFNRADLHRFPIRRGR